ncbi:hypothetical protein PAMC26577_02950 [Caballeronia sordidicola]|uniref:Uncharacterized protein n=1 Tax=Caballeronia sordidicola TaxID=196367 RepID=A0A242N5I9_CABSO|nr:hypothetical protein PAMC26577_02950 [Caballeronia sordidicola]
MAVKRLQGVCVAPTDAPFKQLQSVAIVAMFLGLGLTSANVGNLISMS